MEYKFKASEYLDEDEIFPIEEFISDVNEGGFVDSDGFGHPVVDGKICIDFIIYPSEVNELNFEKITHVGWFGQ